MSRTRKTEITDHLGNVYRSRVELCKHYGVPLTTFCYRRKSGLSIESALKNKKRVDLNQLRFKFIIKHPDYTLFWEKYNSMC